MRKKVFKKAPRYSREYRKMMRLHHKEIMKQARFVSRNPWNGAEDIAYLVADCLRHMRDYYALGENVHSEEQKGHDRATTLTKALKEFDQWETCEDKYFTEDGFLVLISECTPSETLNALVEEQKDHWRKFWAIIAREAPYWWD